MKKARKLLITLLILTFVLSTVSVGFAADTTTAADTKTPASVIRAQALGILRGDEKGNLNLDKPITRAEALALIIRISGLEGSADLMKGQTKFADVAADHWASGYINLGVGQGIVNGYPDGTFKPNDNVTYAQMAKMLLYAMNYGVTVEGAPWPAGVMGKADDLGLFDGVNAVPNVPALRGAVVEMIDNSLTVKHLKQTGYGDLKQYEEGTETFLSKMDSKEIEGRVIEVDADRQEVTIKDDDGAVDTYSVVDSIDPEALLGLKVTAWANDDDEIFFVDYDKDQLKNDIISEDVTDEDFDGTKLTQIDLKIADDTYDVADDATIYVDGAKVTGKDAIKAALKKGVYGTFAFDKGDIVFMNLMSWDYDAVLVKEVDTKDETITYYDGTSEDELDLTDPDSYKITINGESAKLEDIKANDVMYVADYDDIYHIVIVRKTVEGKLERVKSDELKIDGTTYDVAKAADDTIMATFSPNKNDDLYSYSVDASALDDLLNEDTTAVLDLAGDVRHLISDVETTSDDYYGVALKVDDYNETVKVNVKGESKSYDIDADIHDLRTAGASDLTLSGLKALVNDTNNQYAIVKFTLDKDGVINEMWVYATAAKQADETWTVTPSAAAIDSFDKDDDVINSGSNHYFVDENTIIVDELDDIDLVKWDNIKDKDITGGKGIIVADGLDAKFVVFTAGYDSIAEEDEELGVVLDKFKDADGDWAATVKVYNGEEKDYKLNSRTAQSVGDITFFTVNADGDLTVSDVIYGSDNTIDAVHNTVSIASGAVSEKGSDSIKIGGTTYKVNSKTLVFDVTDGLSNIDTAAYRDVRNGDTVKAVVENSLVKIIYITVKH
ncbi:S-layer homology domain-containing protein [Biomaibacter acetigenes]|uniref:S-layer homology domain-containing protein n=1 Tax=Biomaibacter acetigenes TaxID=2316383 RepID=A0A3G2R976_9FIRM|nr:S-layer homology domain-containing protein [Biomaibacter acetigenes]AYO31973.1 S-layer homology domain-containing protein [Biomaibacter acetigenes]